MHVGILGGGQLAKMLAEAGKPLGHSFSFAVDHLDVAQAIEGLGDIIPTSDSDQYKNTALSAESLFEALGKPEVITVESENVSTDLLDVLAKLTDISPPAIAVKMTQHRAREKTFLADLRLPVTRFAIANTLPDIEKALQDFHYKAVIKSCENGYDGKNQWRFKSASDLPGFSAQYKETMGTDEGEQTGFEVIIEEFVAFSTEISLVATRAKNGEVRFYPLTENVHENGILLTSMVVDAGTIFPYANGNASLSAAQLNQTAQSYLQKIVEKLDYVGTIAMECFLVGDQLLINELAPRVHNSGHWTQAGCKASQFENHIRAITGGELGDTERLHPAAMLNLLGTDAKGVQLPPEASYHWYGKDCKPGRKVGHINISASNQSTVATLLSQLKEAVYGN